MNAFPTISRVLCLLGCLLLGGTGLMAQTRVTGRITEPATGQGVPGVKLRLSTPSPTTVFDTPRFYDEVAPVRVQTVGGDSFGSTSFDLNADVGPIYPGGPSDNFSIVANCSFNLLFGPVIFDIVAGSDDGSRVYLDGTEIINNDFLHGFQTSSRAVTVFPGDHFLSVTMFEAGGAARLYMYANAVAPLIAPSFSPWTVRYYDLANLAMVTTAADGSYVLPGTSVGAVTVTPLASGDQVFSPASDTFYLFQRTTANFTLIRSSPSLSIPNHERRPVPGLFNTGVDASGALLPNNGLDPHFTLVQSPDASAPGPGTYVVDDTTGPIGGSWLGNGPSSKWIAPQANQSVGNAAGDYRYRQTFSLSGVDPSTVILTGRWTSDNDGIGVFINGIPTGLSLGPANYPSFSPDFTITNGFVEGLNTLDFVVRNGGGPTGFRAELSATAAGPKIIIAEDQGPVRVPITIGDFQTPAGQLTVDVSSSNPSLIPPANISVNGTGNDRTLEFTSASNQNGTSTLTLRVTDGDGMTVSRLVEVVVTPVNDLPVFSGANSSTAPEDTPTQTITFNVSDAEVAAVNLTLTVVSNSNLAVAPAPALGGVGAVRTLTVSSPLNLNGRAVVTLALFDGQLTTLQDFTFDVTPINDPPIVGAFAGSLRALALDGASHMVQASSVGGLDFGNSSHTIEAWIRPAPLLAGRSWPLVLGQSGSGAHHWLLVPAVGDPNKVAIRFGVWSGAQVSGPTLDVNTWQHVAATWDSESDTLTVYVNGVPVGQSTGVDADDSINFTSTALTLGQARQGEQPFVGALDELRVWTRALTGDQIGAGRNYPLAGNEPQLALYWRFDEQLTTRVPDSAVLGGRSDGVISGIVAHVEPPGAPFGVRVIDEDTLALVFLPAFDIESHFGEAGAALEFFVTQMPQHGTLDRVTGSIYSLSENPLHYLPATNYNGLDSFSYQVIDNGNLTAGPVTVNLSVEALNDLPTISTLANQIIEEDTASAGLPLIVRDAESQPVKLIVTPVPDNLTLIPMQNVTITGTGTNRTVVIRPAAGEIGTTRLTLILTDENGGFASTSFQVRVVPKPAYALVDLGDLPGRPSSFGFGVNDQVWIAGSVQSQPSDVHATLFKGFAGNDRLLDLETLGGPTATANAINGSNIIAGFVTRTGNLNREAAIWDNGAWAGLGFLPGGTYSEALAINRSSAIVGFSQMAGGRLGAFVHTAGSMQALPAFPNAIGTVATAIADDGWIAGYATFADGTESVFDGTVNALSLRGVFGLPKGRALGVNNSRVMVGYEETAGGVRQAFLLDTPAGTGPVNLGKLPGQNNAVARAINNFNQIVGQSGNSASSQRAFLHSAGRLNDLNDIIFDSRTSDGNDFVFAESNWVLNDAASVNNDGFIVGTGTKSGVPRSYLAVPAWVIGRSIARPEGAVARLPEIEILHGQSGDNGQNAFFWSAVENRLYAIRPVTARLKWFTSFTDSSGSGSNLVVNTDRIVSIGINVWPKNSTVHVTTVPSEVEPQGVTFGYGFQSVLYYTAQGVSVDTSTKRFNDLLPGYSVLYYLKTDGFDPNPTLQRPIFDVVKSVRMEDVRTDQAALVGDAVINATHFDYLGKNGFVYFPNAFYDGAGLDRAYNRDTRLGPILPVNTRTAATARDTNELIVVWYHTNRLGVAWADAPVRYTVQWPPNVDTIVIANGLGSGRFPTETMQDPNVYNQPDPRQPGYNPNEEHALIATLGGGPSLLALRNDLNAIQNQSDPYALVKFRDAATGQWQIKPFKVLAEGVWTNGIHYTFTYPAEAGLELQPPFPLSMLTLCGASYGVPDKGPWWEDYHGKFYARAAGPSGGATNILVRFFYPLEPEFWYDLNGNGTNDASVGTCIAWLDRHPAGQLSGSNSGRGTDGTPIDINYRVTWPKNPATLEIGSSLLRSRNGLPDVFNMARVETIFDDLNPTWRYDLDSAPTLALARLYDPVSARTVPVQPPTLLDDLGIARENRNGKQVFPDLPAALKQRLTFDLVNRTLTFGGVVDYAFGAGPNPLILPNVMNPRERDRIKQLAPGSSAWAGIIDSLYWLTRNPNRVDILPKDGQADQDLRMGLVANSSGRVVFEQFGDGPKSLTAALTNVPPAQPNPGLAFSNSGGAWVAVQSFANLDDDFTISVWAKLGANSNGSLFTNGPAPGGGLLLRPDVSSGRILFSDRASSGGVVHQVSQIFDTNWHHYAMVRGGTNLLLYLDGVMIASRPAAGVRDTSNFRLAHLMVGQVDEFELWDIALSGDQIRSQMNKALNGFEGGLRVYFRFDDGAGVTSFIDSTPNRFVATRSGNQGVILPSTAPAGIPPRFITLAENNDPTLPGLPVALHVIRVDDGPYAGDVKILPGDNVFDERVTLRHSSDFGGAPEQVQFEWYYKPDAADFDPTTLPSVNPLTGTITDARGWLNYPVSGAGINDITIGEGRESSLLTLGDNWFICRYRGYPVGLRPATLWSDWLGDPSGIGEPRAALVEGWIKRVIRGLNPFDARTADFHSSAVNTYASMLVQVGPRYEGPIAFNGNADNLNSIGLIQAYQTVLERGKKLSIEGAPPVNFDAANNALLLVSSKLSDFYMLLGNEAFADAQDPTIGFGTSSGEYGTLAPSIFPFQNQLDSLLSEELALLRGRDDRNAGVRAAPVYNRLFWNFTLGEGEVAYQQAYNVRDQNFDGFIDEKDSRILYPQAHGDAWGHYLTAINFYYQLMRHPQFTWKPRTESVSIAGVAVEVDFLDERKFCRVAAARAKAGREIVDLEYRNHYVEDPAGQWQGYKDTDSDRSWGVDEWARRVGQGAFFDWLAANAVLPSVDPNPAHLGIQKIDRTTVAELGEIIGYYGAVQNKMDEADAGLNPVGLAKGSLPFDIDPTFLEVGSTAQIGRRAVQGLFQFDQILERGVAALKNATAVWDQANKTTELLRRNQDSGDQFTRNVRDQEFDYKSRLIEIFGYPYAGDIGAGRTYPSGYDGPDLYHHMYVNTTEITGQNSPPNSQFTGYFTAPRAGLRTNDFWLGFAPATLETGILPVIYPQSASDYSFVAPAAWGQRRAPGELQLALSDMVQADAQLKIAMQTYDGLIQDIQAGIDLLQAQYNVNGDKIHLLTKNREAISDLNTRIRSAKSIELGYNRAASVAEETARGISEAIPESTIVGLAFGGDLLAPVRGGILIGALVLKQAFGVGADVAAAAQTHSELAKEETQLQTDIKLEVVDQRFEVLQRVKDLEHLVRDEAAARLAAYNQAEVVHQTAGRYFAKVAEGERLIEQLVRFRKDAAADVSAARYEDMTFRIFRNDALQKYRAAFDIAARYVYLAANAYDYEVNFLATDPLAGRRFLTDIVRQRNIGQMVDGNPAVGTAGLADSLARLEANWAVVKPRFGVINPQIADTRFSLREEAFRINGSADSNLRWQDELQKARVPNLWSVPEFRRFCRPFAPESAGAQPGLVIRFPTTITFGLNYFGWPLAGGDSSYDSSQFSTKIAKCGIWFSGSDPGAVAATPRFYLVPIGMDVMRTPTGNTTATREWRIIDQVIPVPFPIGANDLNNPNWIPMNDSLGGSFAQVRRYAAIPARHDSGLYAEADLTNDNRLIGRSAWNTGWMLIIPGGTLLNDPDAGLEAFINSVTDIKIYFQTYSYSGD